MLKSLIETEYANGFVAYICQINSLRVTEVWLL